MVFERILVPADKVTVVLEQEADGRPVAVVRSVAGAGRRREKRVKSTGKFTASLYEHLAKSVVERAIVALLKEGYVARPNQDGPILWMTYSDVGYPIGHPFAVDDRSGVWVGGTGVLHRIDRATADSVAFAIPYPEEVVVSHVAVGPGGEVAVLAESVAVGRYLVFRVVNGASLALVARVDFTKHSCERIASSISVAAGGRILGPHEDGAALFEPDGTLVRTFSVGRTKSATPVAAVDGAGTVAVVTVADGRLRVVDLTTGKETALTGLFESVAELAVRPDLSVDVWEHSGDWGMYRLSPNGRCSRLSAERSAYGAITQDGLRMATCEGGTLFVRDTRTKEVIRSAPLLGAARSARVCFTGDGQIVARTDSGITLAIDPDRLREPTTLESLIHSAPDVGLAS
jgi:hypothetical protein